jgi:hypothetical protein
MQPKPLRSDEPFAMRRRACKKGPAPSQTMLSRLASKMGALAPRGCAERPCRCLNIRPATKTLCLSMRLVHRARILLNFSSSTVRHNPVPGTPSHEHVDAPEMAQRHVSLGLIAGLTTPLCLWIEEMPRFGNTDITGGERAATSQGRR